MKKTILIFLLTSCSPAKELQDEKQYITIEGKCIELVSDEEYGNLYMKQKIGNSVIYIPYTFEVDDSEPPDIKEYFTTY